MNDEKSLNKYQNEREKTYLKTIVKNSLCGFASLLNIGKNLTPNQIETIIGLIIEEEEFKNFKPSEIKEAFYRGCKGNYGKIFDRVDLEIVFGWLRSYQAERDQAIEEYRIKEASQYKADSKEGYKALRNIKLPIKEARLETPQKKHECSEIEIELNGYLQEFDKLPEIEGSKNIRFVHYKNKVLDVHAYCSLRWEENQNQNSE